MNEKEKKRQSGGIATGYNEKKRERKKVVEKLSVDLPATFQKIACPWIG